ncbi:MAG: DUF5667 domain-containing protein [Chloroflexota bacterium]
MNTQDETDPKVIALLKTLEPVPARDPGAARRARAKFLNQASEMRQAVSSGGWLRHKVQNLNPRKEKFAMNILVSVLLAAAMLMGGGVTLAAAQDDLPNEPLYGVKVFAEDVGLSLTGDPEAKVERLMDLSQVRAQEMAALAEDGQAVPEPVLLRLELHVEQALETAATLEEDADLTQTLLQLRDRLQTQDRLLSQLQTDASTEEEPLLTRTRDRLQDRLCQVEDGLADPDGFRYTMQNEMRYGQDESLEPGPNQQGEPGFHQNTEPVETETPPDPVETKVPPVDATPEAPTWNTAPDAPQNGNGQGNPQQGGNGPGSGNGNH